MTKGDLIRNSSWGIVSHIAQTVLISLFFVILARRYPTDDFAKFMIATALAQMVSAFSGLGLGQWFIREVVGTEDRRPLIVTFLTTQIYSGVFFYVVAVALAVVIYDDPTIRLIAAVFGVNVVFDNIVNGLKCLNIADLQQRKTFAILTLEAFLKCAGGAVLAAASVSIVTLSLILLGLRAVTLKLFLRLGTSSEVSVAMLFQRRPGAAAEIRRLVLSNWVWVIIGGSSVVNWRIANIIVSKELGLTSTAIYEICYRLFAIAQTVPVIVGTAVFPMLIRLYRAADTERFRSLYRRMYVCYSIFGLLAYTFTYSFADVVMPFAFGARYAGAAPYAAQMFLTMIVFPTAFLQGNVLFALNLERRDMWLNLVLLAFNVVLCLIGLRISRTLTTINAALFLSFVVFHLAQDVMLIRQGVSSVRQVGASHLAALGCVLSYSALARASGDLVVFPVYWAAVLLVVIGMHRHELGLQPYLMRAGALIRP